MLRLPFIFEVLIPVLFFVLLIGGQIFWIRRLRELGRRLIRSVTWREWIGAALLAVYAFVMIYNFVPLWWLRAPTPVRMTATDALLDAPFQWWLFGSVIGFLLVVILRLPDYLFRGLFRAGRWLYRVGRRLLVRDARKAQAGADAGSAPLKSSRRRFLEQATMAAGTIPFAAAFYGLVHGRLEIETNHYRVALGRLPKGFDGFRIAQLSDIHIGPFMTAAEIRHVVDLTNRLKPDLILLTGDYVIWDPSTQGAVVDVLSGLRAPHGVFGSLGNHEAWARITDSITRLFTAQGTTILRTARATLRAGGDEVNLIGVDYQSHRPAGEHVEGVVRRYLDGVQPLVRDDTANILLSHNPNTFDRAAELGIDLSLAGHTHGGQVALEFISPQISPSRLITPYVWGWFEKPGGKLYVNRGIGTIGIPMRMGAPPEITVYELVRKA